MREAALRPAEGLDRRHRAPYSCESGLPLRCRSEYLEWAMSLLRPHWRMKITECRNPRTGTRGSAATSSPHHWTPAFAGVENRHAILIAMAHAG